MTEFLFLDDYHAGDPLFLADLGRRLSTRGPAGCTVIFHATDEEVNRELEAWDEEDAGSRGLVVDRAIRQTNQTITRRLIEEGVPAVAILGSSKGLLTGDDAHGVKTGRTEWFNQVISSGTIPVVSPLATAGAVVCAGALVRALASAGSVESALFCRDRKQGLYRDGRRLERVSFEELSSFESQIDTKAAKALAKIADRVVATNSAAVSEVGGILGTEILQLHQP